MSAETNPVPQSGHQSSSQISPLVRAALMITDMESMAHFYRDVIGLLATYYEDIPADAAFNRLIGIESAEQVRVLILKQPSGPNMGMIGLFEAASNRGKPFQKRTGGLAPGEAALVFYVNDIEAIADRIRGTNAEIICPPELLQLSHNTGQKEMTLRDPEGNCINLIERDPSRATMTQPVGTITPVF